MSALSDARDRLHAVCLAADLPDIPATRRHRLPQRGDYVTPCTWVGMPEITARGGEPTVVLSVVVAVDGANQLDQLDDPVAVLWDAIAADTSGNRLAMESTRAEVVQLQPRGTADTLAAVITVVVPTGGGSTLCGPAPLQF